MHLLTPENALEYLCDAGRLDSVEGARAEALAWGVSNLVLRISPREGPAFVLKQSRPQLRTPDPWFSRLDRVWREVAAMRTLGPLLPQGVVPQILFEDRENYLFAMEAAPADHVVWKQRLLDGLPERHIAAFLGTCLAALHRDTALRDDLQRQFGDTEVFVELRVDPFYRRVAEIADDARPVLERMLEEMFATPVCLVHADFSPKNVLIAGQQIVLVDFETAHYGDPAFDLGFFLSHLLLKTIKLRDRFDAFADLTNAFWRSYLSGLQPLAGEPPFAPGDLYRRTLQHLAGCMWARIDGVSKVDYLPDSSEHKLVRRYCRSLLLEPPSDWPRAIDRLRAMTIDTFENPSTRD